jgi:hypothetical protein
VQRGQSLLSRVDGGWILAALVAIGALGLRIPGAVRDAFWQDEVASARIVHLASPVAALRQVARGEATPPLWYMLGWLLHTAGASPWDYRWLSVAAGAAAAAAAFYCAQRVLPTWAAVFAGSVTAVAWELVVHGRELRAYALFSLLTVVFPLALLRAVRRPDRQSLIMLAAVVACGTMTNYFFGLSVLAGAGWLWLEPAVGTRARRPTLAIAVGLIPLVLWSPVLIHQYRAERFAWIGPFSIRRLVDTPWLLFVHHVPGGALRTLAPWLFLVVLAAGVAALGARSAEGRLLASLAAVPFVLTTLAWAAGAHVFAARNLIGVVPFAAIALAAVTARLPRAAGVPVAVGALAALAVGSIRAEATPPTPYDRIADQLAADGWRPQDPIVLLGNFFAFRSPLEWYLPQQPRLTLGLRQAAGSCPAVYVVAQGPRNRARIARSRVLRTSRVVGGVLVGRLNTSTLPRLAGSSSFTTTAGALCVRPVAEARLVAELHRLRLPNA